MVLDASPPGSPRRRRTTHFADDTNPILETFKAAVSGATREKEVSSRVAKDVSRLWRRIHTDRRESDLAFEEGNIRTEAGSILKVPLDGELRDTVDTSTASQHAWLQQNKQRVKAMLQQIESDCSRVQASDILKILPCNEIVRLKQRFESSEEGKVTKQNFTQHMLNSLENVKTVSPQESEELAEGLSELFFAIDFDGSGSVSWEEFTHYLVNSYAVASLQTNEFLPYHITNVQLKGREPSRGSKLSWVEGLNKLMSIDTTERSVVKIFGTDDIHEELCAAFEHECTVLSSVYLPQKNRFIFGTEQSCLDHYVYKPDGQMRLAEATEPIAVDFSSKNNKRTERSRQRRYNLARQRLKHVFRVRCDSPSLVLHWDDHMGPNGMLFSGTRTGEVLVYDVTGNEVGVGSCETISQQRVHTEPISGLQTIPGVFSSPRKLVTASFFGRITLTDLEKDISTELKGTLRSHRHHQGVHCIDYSADLNILITSGVESDPIVWAPTQAHSQFIERLTDTEDPHKCALLGAHIIPGTNQIVSCDASGCMKMWDLRKWQCMQTWYLERGLTSLQAMAFEATNFAMDPSPDTHAVYCMAKTDTNESKLYTLCPQIRPKVNTVSTHDKLVIRVLYNEATQTFITAASTEVKIWDCVTGAVVLNIFDVVDTEITCLALDDRGRRFLLGTHTGGVTLHSYATGALIQKFLGPTSEISEVLYLSHPKLICAGGRSGFIYIFEDTEASVYPHQTLQCSAGISSMTYSPNLHLLCAGDSVDNVYVYDMHSCLSFNLLHKKTERSDRTQYESTNESRMEMYFFDSASEITATCLMCPLAAVVHANDQGLLKITTVRPANSPYAVVSTWKTPPAKANAISTVTTAIAWSMEAGQSIIAGDDHGNVSVWDTREVVVATGLAPTAFPPVWESRENDDNPRTKPPTPSAKTQDVRKTPRLAHYWAVTKHPITHLGIVGTTDAVAAVASGDTVHLYTLEGFPLGQLSQGRNETSPASGLPAYSFSFDPKKIQETRMYARRRRASRRSVDDGEGKDVLSDDRRGSKRAWGLVKNAISGNDGFDSTTSPLRTILSLVKSEDLLQHFVEGREMNTPPQSPRRPNAPPSSPRAPPSGQPILRASLHCNQTTALTQSIASPLSSIQKRRLLHDQKIHLRLEKACVHKVATIGNEAAALLWSIVRGEAEDQSKTKVFLKDDEECLSDEVLEGIRRASVANIENEEGHGDDDDIRSPTEAMLFRRLPLKAYSAPSSVHVRTSLPTLEELLVVPPAAEWIRKELTTGCTGECLIAHDLMREDKVEVVRRGTQRSVRRSVSAATRGSTANGVGSTTQCMPTPTEPNIVPSELLVGPELWGDHDSFFEYHNKSGEKDSEFAGLLNRTEGYPLVESPYLSLGSKPFAQGRVDPEVAAPTTPLLLSSPQPSRKQVAPSEYYKSSSFCADIGEPPLSIQNKVPPVGLQNVQSRPSLDEFRPSPRESIRRRCSVSSPRRTPSAGNTQRPSQPAPKKGSRTRSMECDEENNFDSPRGRKVALLRSLQQHDPDPGVLAMCVAALCVALSTFEGQDVIAEMSGHVFYRVGADMHLASLRGGSASWWIGRIASIACHPPWKDLLLDFHKDGDQRPPQWPVSIGEFDSATRDKLRGIASVGAQCNVDVACLAELLQGFEETHTQMTAADRRHTSLCSAMLQEDPASFPQLFRRRLGVVMERRKSSMNFNAGGEECVSPKKRHFSLGNAKFDPHEKKVSPTVRPGSALGALKRGTNVVRLQTALRKGEKQMCADSALLACVAQESGVPSTRSPAVSSTRKSVSSTPFQTPTAGSSKSLNGTAATQYLPQESPWGIIQRAAAAATLRPDSGCVANLGTRQSKSVLQKLAGRHCAARGGLGVKTAYGTMRNDLIAPEGTTPKPLRKVRRRPAMGLAIARKADKVEKTAPPWPRVGLEGGFRGHGAFRFKTALASRRGVAAVVAASMNQANTTLTPSTTTGVRGTVDTALQDTEMSEVQVAAEERAVPQVADVLAASPQNDDEHDDDSTMLEEHLLGTAGFVSSPESFS